MISLPHPIRIQIQVSVLITVYFVFMSVILLLREKFENAGAVLGGKNTTFASSVKLCCGDEQHTG
jgi:preprotein translocase subunit SecG